MPRKLSLLTLSLAAVVASCRPPAYVEPTANEPHAILKVRHVVHQRRGPIYDSDVMLGRWAIDERTVDVSASDEGIIHLRVRPESATLRVAGTSYHIERRLVTRTRTVYETYSCQEYRCTGYGTSQRCGNQSSTCRRSRQETYQEWQNVPVTDDQCGANVWFAPTVGGVYLVQFDYLGENQCTLSCFEQVPSVDGQFSLRECPPAPPQVATASR